ncbi:GNAT family N-acetyltransferase [Nocardiopsis trehalosi]|uniref:GNAT family N-acetyltransferase n=1 Tax=Nocardiopsis trehalosi TaxID=109329 RepID=UPI00082BFCAD|nr:GNAT family N-acetyltransferase [Nocardiopsis trehalosi]
MPTVELRPAVPGDAEFCFRLHRAALGPYVAQVWGWDEAEQRAYHRRSFRAAGRWIIAVDGVDAGVLALDHGAAEDYLGLIELHPRFQGRGIGSRVLRCLLDRAAGRGRDLVVDVLTVNHRARAFYLRHGFREEGRHGEGGRKVRLRAVPREGGAAPSPDRPR